MIKTKLLFYVYILCTLNFEFEVLAQDKLVGIPIVDYYSSQDYNGGIQNYAITQDYRGLILVANNQGLLEYDGSNWRIFKVRTGKVRSVLPDKSGKIFIGGQNEFGYFFPNEVGAYVYHSLNDLIPESHSDFDDIWNIYLHDSDYVFTNSKNMFFYTGDSINITPLPKWNVHSFQHRNRIYNRAEGVGLMHYKNNSWELIDQGEFFADKDVRAVLYHSMEYDLVGTYNSGIFLVNSREVIPWAEQYNEFFRNYKINTIIGLNNGDIVVGTDTNGIYILGKNGVLNYHFTEGKGLKNSTILSIYEDSFGNIWIGHNNGISKIQLNSPISYINEDLALQGTGYAICENEDFVYLGTNNGLYYYQRNQTPVLEGIKEIENINGQVYDIKDVNGDILVACHFGAYQIDGNKALEISDGIGWWTFVETPIPDIAIGGGYAGLFLLRKSKDVWRVEKYYSNFTESCRVMEFDEDGVLWMSHGYKGVYSFRFSEDFETITEINYYDESKGFPSKLLINTFKLDNKTIFTAEKGIYSYDQTNDSFLPHEELNNLIGPDIHIRYLMNDRSGDTYFITNNFTGALRKNNWGYNLESNIFNNVHPHLNDDLERLYVMDQGNIMFAANNGFIHYNSSISEIASRDIKVLLRSINLTRSDSILFDGSFLENDQVLEEQNLSAIPSLAYRDNDISFSYSAIDFNQTSAQYRYLLEGFVDEWSDWTTKVEKEYTNLNEGDYTFQVEAKNVFGTTSNIASYQFSILPPWYRTGYAYALYVFVVITTISGFIIRNRRNKLIIKKQEEEIVYQGQHIQEVSARSKEEIDRLEKEKLENEILHKRKELASSTMHLANKTNFINSIKSEITDLLRDNSSTEIPRKLKRIIKEIDKNIEEEKDWNQFEIHFDEVYKDFIKRLREEFPEITPQETKLCAYLRMNLTSKEIANLLHITVRGVEMSRYRLRKKLHLGKNDNLTDFILDL